MLKIPLQIMLFTHFFNFSSEIRKKKSNMKSKMKKKKFLYRKKVFFFDKSNEVELLRNLMLF